MTSTPFTANGQGLDAFFDGYRLTAPSAGSVQIASATSGLTLSVSLPPAAGSPSTVTSSISYTVGGNVSGLVGGSLTLLLNGANPLVVTGEGAFTFPASVITTYAVTVDSQPTGQTCTVSNGSGAGMTADISNIGVVCSADSYAISGTVAGLTSGAQVILANNGANPTTVTSNGTFSFSTRVAYNGSYSVTVGTQPRGRSHGLQRVRRGRDCECIEREPCVFHRDLHCRRNHESLGQQLRGYASEQRQRSTYDNRQRRVHVCDSCGIRQQLRCDDRYAADRPDLHSIQWNWHGRDCQYMDVSIVCSTATFNIGGTVSGLATNSQVTLRNNGSNALTVGANGAFTFATPVAYGSSYAVTIGTQPTGQICTASNGSGTGVSVGVSNISIVCSTATFNIGGTVSGLVTNSRLRSETTAAMRLW